MLFTSDWFAPLTIPGPSPLRAADELGYNIAWPKYKSHSG